jgi:hypothetical protein
MEISIKIKRNNASDKEVIGLLQDKMPKCLDGCWRLCGDDLFCVFIHPSFDEGQSFKQEEIVKLKEEVKQIIFQIEKGLSNGI